MSASQDPASVLDPSGRRVDRAHRCLNEPYTGLDDVTVRVAHCLGDRAPEHHIELGEAEHEGLGLVDQHDLDLVTELLG